MIRSQAWAVTLAFEKKEQMRETPMMTGLKIGFTLDARLEADSEQLMWLGLCELRVMNDQRWPWLLLVPQRPGAEEIHDMTPLDQAMLTFETNMVAQALKKATGCHKINRRRWAIWCGSFTFISSPGRKAIRAGRVRSGATACASPTGRRTFAGLPKK